MESSFASCYEQWIQGQKSDLTDLIRLTTTPGATEMHLRRIIEQCMRSYESYMERRKSMVREDGPTFYSPPWCTSLENSVLWIGGCRPSLMIRLLYSLTGCEMEAHLEEFLQGQRSPSSIGTMNLSSRQLNQVNELHQRTLRTEDWLSSRQASLQEDIADKPLFPLVRETQRTITATVRTSVPVEASSSLSSQYHGDSNRDFDAGDHNAEVEAVMKTYSDGMAKLVEEADALRLATVKALALEILGSKQAIQLLIAAKQLHLSIHDWGVQRDRQHGRN